MCLLCLLRTPPKQPKLWEIYPPIYPGFAIRHPTHHGRVTNFVAHFIIPYLVSEAEECQFSGEKVSELKFCGEKVSELTFSDKKSIRFKILW